ncbi:MAG: folylpolyglutamate synthase/dihydrofolate synthase family protein [Anaerolineae bacterium]|nr:folylpolyglutamate synthase/dihydrofolate synthase family protein [Anaerolineae bacterium]
MRYEEALDYLSRFINYEKKMTEQYAPEKMDPGRPGRLLQLFGDPQRQFPSIHIAGSKGKGSVAAMSAAALHAAGLRVGLYTSPHLQDFRERIRVLTADDAEGMIPREIVAALVARLQEVAPAVPGLTWFELVTALGFLYFAEAGVDVAVVEVGLGGRLDATNVLVPLVSVITRLELEHTALLGNTLAEIAAEKGGIIKEGVPLVSAPQAEEAVACLEAIAAERRAPFTLAGREWQATGQAAAGLDADQQITVTTSPVPAVIPPGTTFTLRLLGEHQQENALVALATLAEIHQHFPELSLAAMREGLSAVHWPGRLQLLHRAPALVVDGAHTPQGARRLAEALQALHPQGRLWLVVGVTADKDVRAVLQPLLAQATGIFATQADHPRAATAEEVAGVIAQLGYDAQPLPTVCAALEAAWALAAAGDLICATGSLFVAADLLNCWEKLQSTMLKREWDATEGSRDRV